MNKLVFLSLLLFFGFYNSLAFSATWQRVNIGGGGVMNMVAAGPTGTMVAGTDLAGAYIKKSSDPEWRLLGSLNNTLPETHITSVAFDQSNANIILLSTDQGLYRSSNEGTSFVHVDRPNESSMSYFGGKFIALAYQQSLSANTSRRVYASKISSFKATDGSVLRSDDGGKTFQTTASLPSNTVITKLVMHPVYPDIVIALSNEERFVSPQNAVYLSTNGGGSWTPIMQAIGDIQDVAFHPVSPHRVFLSNRSGSSTANLFRCLINQNTNNCNALNPNDALFSQTGEGPPVLALWPEQGSDSNAIKVININTAWSHDDQAAWRFTNGNWSTPQTLGESSEWTGDEVDWKLGWSKLNSTLNPSEESVNHTLGFDLSNPNRILWATHQFVFEGLFNTQTNQLSMRNLTTQGSDAGGWSSQGLDNITPFILDVNASDPKVIYAGLNDLGCTVSRDGGATWRLCIHDSSPDVFDSGAWPDGFPAPFKSYGGVVSALISDPKHAQNVWMFASADQGQPVALKRSKDFGLHWVAVPWAGSPAPNTPDIYGLSVDTSTAATQRLFVTANGKVYRSVDDGDHWTMVHDCLVAEYNAGGCRVTKVGANGYIYAGGEAGLFVSKNHGASWQPLLSQLSIDGLRVQDNSQTEENELGAIFSRDGWAGISGITIDKSHPNIVYAAAFSAETTQGIYRCNMVDNSCNPVLSSAIFSKPVAYMRDVVVDPNNSQILYATSSSAYTSGGLYENSLGVLRSTDGGTSWSEFNAGLAWPMAIPIRFDPNNSQILYTGSPGGGNYKIVLDDKPQLISPLGTSNNPPVFKWQRVDGASSYLLFVNEYGEPNVPGKINMSYTPLEAGCVTDLVCEVSPNIPFKIVPSEWWITAEKNGQSLLSDSGRFSIVLDGIPPPSNPNNPDSDSPNNDAPNDSTDSDSNTSTGGGGIGFGWLMLFLGLIYLRKS